MKFILEGPDGSGKSMLASHLAEKFGLSTMHCTRLDSADGMRRQFEEAHNALIGGNMILDRYILSNLVYSKVFAGAVDSTVTARRRYYADMLRDDVTTIVCLPYYNSTYSRLEYENHFERLSGSREEMYTDVQKMLNVYDMFSAGYETLLDVGANVEVYDFTDHGLWMDEYTDRFKP